MESKAVKGVPPAQAGEPAARTYAGDDAPVWEGLEDTREFKRLLAARMRFVVPATIFFLVYYFALPILNGMAPEFMRTKVIGNVNIAYLFALSEFFMAWILAWLYIRRANNVFDPMAAAVRRLAARRGTGGRR
jgi:uncharacterized membrane protein (DUF485 family)